jgi:predicted nuclease of predicted toxin-antitoxin system
MNQKKLKFLVDVGVSKKVEEWLLRNGYDLKAVRDINPKMDDNEILSIVVSENRMVVTMDKDFGELVHNSGLLHSGVLLLRLEDANSDEKVKIIEKILTEYSDRLLNNFCVFQRGILRIRK